MAVRQRGNKWIADVTKGTQRLRVSCSSHHDAKLKEAELKVQLGSGIIVKNAKSKSITTLDDLMKETYTRYWVNTKGENTALLNARKCLEVLSPSKEVKNITYDDYDALVEHFKALNNSTATINRKLSAFSKMLSTAYQLGLLDKVIKITFLKETKHRDRFMSDIEEIEMLNLLSEEYKDFVTCLLDLGCRYSELVKVTRQDIDNNFVRLHDRKNGESSLLPMTKRVRKILESRTFENLDYHKFNKAWNDAKDKLGLSKDKDFTPHVCRHTFASRLLQRGQDVIIVSRFLGHKNINITLDRYGHLATKNMEDAISVLE